MYFDETICAPATIPGTGAISIIRISGPETFRIVDELVSFKNGKAADAPGYTIKFGSVYRDGELLDEVLVSVFHSPNSYTGEDSVEISCHASSYIVSSLIEMLVMAGCRPAEGGEFTKRAYLNGKMDLAEAEAVADVIASGSAAAHRVAINQMKGGMSRELRGMRDELLKLATLLELELDFSEEEVEFADRSALNALVEKLSAHIRELIDSFRYGNAIKNGVPVAIAGAPNSGKSTLLNALLGDDRAIVSDIPGTTRDTVEDTVVLDGLQFRFIDTAGIRDTSDIIEKMGVERSYEAIAKAEIVLGVIDSSKPENERTALLKDITSRMKETQSFIPVYNKADLAETTPKGGVAICAKTGTGLAALREELAKAGRALVGTGGSGSGLVITNARHLAALRSALASLARVRDALASSVPSDLVAEDLRAATRSLNEIFLDRDSTIEATSILNNVFANFCIGK